METTSTTDTPPALTHVKVTDNNHSFVGKVFKIVEESEEWVIAEFKVGETFFSQLFHKGQVTKVADPSTTAQA